MRLIYKQNESREVLFLQGNVQGVHWNLTIQTHPLEKKMGVPSGIKGREEKG